MIDSHAHLTSSKLYGKVDDLLGRTQEIAKIVNIATDYDSLIKGIELKKKYPKIYNTCSTTPHDVKEGIVDPKILEKHAGDLVAIGETGLDYYYEHSPKKDQIRAFIQYLELAKSLNKPIVIHCRDAFSDLFPLLDIHFRGGKGVLHCFTGNYDEALEGIERGLFVSFSGIVTFKKSLELQIIAKKIPIEYLLVETDCPYLAPQKHRGEENEPSFLRETVQFIADLRGVSFEEILKETALNATKLFHLE